MTDKQKVQLKWESIDDYHHRAKVFGGWLFKAYESVTQFQENGPPLEHIDWRMSVCFMADPEHKWGDVNHTCSQCLTMKNECHCGYGVKPKNVSLKVPYDEATGREFIDVQGNLRSKEGVVSRCLNDSCNYWFNTEIRCPLNEDGFCPTCGWSESKPDDAIVIDFANNGKTCKNNQCGNLEKTGGHPAFLMENGECPICQWTGSGPAPEMDNCCKNSQCENFLTNNTRMLLSSDGECPVCQWKPMTYCNCVAPIQEYDHERNIDMCLKCKLEIITLFDQNCLCDGCNVLIPFEHRCHGIDACSCKDCNPGRCNKYDDHIFELSGETGTQVCTICGDDSGVPF